ncbi:dihydrodipicolinate synthase family protein [Pseudalkalibacillus sp. A8]|uniref:dihydrodipicolinate synthase family protein n=1 Tax=Pseudalkalibacillus sp. A8 TaxID=3382641 RepID=UPI0038B5F19D
MKHLELAKKLETISAINLTPFYKDTKEIDWNSLKANIDFLIANGTEVIVPCGNTGEFYALTLDEVKEVTEKVVDYVDGKAVVMAGIGYSVPTAIELGKAAKNAGTDCVMIHQPIHPYVTDSGAVSYFKEIITNIDLPVVLYFKDPNLSDDILIDLAPLENLVGVKYAINDLPRFTKTVREYPRKDGITWICGSAEKWAPYFYHAGATGFTSGLINIAPEKSFLMLEALKNDDHETVWRVWEDTLPFEELRAKNNNGNNVIVIKEALERISFTAGVTREPVDALSAEDRQGLENILSGWGLLRTGVETV